ncbi:RidA family protein [Chelatococcus asaccharovorans]|uniref:Enamine deaminase RidA (YjgF/YER057c/UK114 family) n=1 Tax=Chelatococcus asaccharovorans TaxID=28210 RepID=A0A2V3UGS7_9HYPH|nr:RidA family protein [Chelatococcus asaccharovorans]MBS7701831.1 RidA family protein [Chelatococcus asaccharovorans]PXW64461.1 enamine deaminase RidA (YjgF/YER057c/UK114 family) [Chelatococcus asaccharovorans]
MDKVPFHWQAALDAAGIVLPAAAPPAAAYTPVVVHQGLAFVSGQLPRDETGVRTVGLVGVETTLAAAQEGARLALVRGLAALRDGLGGLDRLDRILKMTVFVQSGPDFVDQSAVADGASTLLFELLGLERGRHARSAVGVAKLPRNAAVEIELIASVRPVAGP